MSTAKESVSILSIQQLLRTPETWPDNVRAVFEVLILPIVLVRRINSQILDNRYSESTNGQLGERWLSEEQLQNLRDEAIRVSEQVRQTLKQLNGVAEETWRAGTDILTHASLVSLKFELAPNRYPESVAAQTRDSCSKQWSKYPQIPLLKELRTAMTKERTIIEAEIGKSDSQKPKEKTQTADRFAELRQFSNNKLKGQQLTVIDALCKARGELPLANIKILCDWQGPIDDSWNSLRKRLREKIKPLGWNVKTHDRKARLEQFPKTNSPKRSRKRR